MNLNTQNSDGREKMSTQTQPKKIQFANFRDVVDETKKYIYGVGRRKESSAVARIYDGPEYVFINKIDYRRYFPRFSAQKGISDILKKTGLTKGLTISLKVSGGGKSSQADAVKLAISRAILKKNPDLRKTLRSEGYLTRDARSKERKKFGLKGARKSPQFAKR